MHEKENYNYEKGYRVRERSKSGDNLQEKRLLRMKCWYTLIGPFKRTRILCETVQVSNVT